MLTFRVMEQLNLVVETLNRLIHHCTNKDGAIRNAPLMLKVVDKLRAAMETVVRFYEDLQKVVRVHDLHRAILEEIAKEAPAVAERLLRLLDAIAAKWC